MIPSATALDCPHCYDNNKTGPTQDDHGTVWWNCECGLTGPAATDAELAILRWNEMVTRICEDERREVWFRSLRARLGKEGKWPLHSEELADQMFGWGMQVELAEQWLRKVFGLYFG